MSKTFSHSVKSRPHPLTVSARIIKCHDNYNYGSQLLNETQSAQKYHFSTFCLSCCSLQYCRQINEAKQNSNLFIAQSVKTLHRNSSFSQKSNNSGLSLCFRPQVLPGQEEDGGGGGEPGDGGAQGGHHAHGEGGGGRGQCPQTGSLRVVTSVLPCGENPS